MIKRPWLLVPSLVLLLATTLLAVASCNLVQTSTSTTSRVKCNEQQTKLDGSGTPITKDSCSRRLLVFSKTGGFRHASIKDGKIALQKLATEHNFGVDFTEDASVFTDAILARYDAVIFLMNTTLDLPPSQPLFSSLYNYSKAIRRDRNGMFREVEGRFFKELS